MVALTWLRGLLAHRRGRAARDRRSASPSASRCWRRSAPSCRRRPSKMTARAIARVPVDWQVEAQPGADPATCCAQVARAARRRARAAGRLRATPPACRRRPAARRRRPGPGKVLGLPDGYARAFPGELRTLAGPRHRRAARPADRRQPARRGPATRSRSAAPAAARRTVRVDGVVDLPAADSLFQQVGAPRRRAAAGAAGQRRAAARSARLRPRSSAARRSRTQVHARLSHAPARQPERRVHAGRRAARATSRRGWPAAALVGDNLGTALDQARQDALYAQLLFLFLGVPGAILAGLVTAVDRRGRRRPPPPRRGAAAHARRLDAPARRASRSAETALAGGAGVARRARRRAARSARPRSAPPASAPARSPRVLWAGGAALAGLLIAAGVDRAARVARRARAHRRRPAPRRSAARDRAPWWARYGLDFVALAGVGARLLAGVAQRLQPRARARGRAAGLGQLVRAARAGAGLDRRRPARLPARRPRPRRAAARRWRARCARSPASSSPTVAATMGRQRRLLAGAVALVALTARVRRLDRGLQRDLPAAGRGRRAADQRRRRDGHRVARRAASGRAARRALAAVAGVAQRRAAAAPLRLRRRRPAGPLRRAPADDRRGRQAPGRLVRRAARAEQLMQRARRSGPTACSSPPRPSTTSSCTRATCCACACRTAAPSSSRPSRSTTSAWPRSSRPRRATRSSSPTRSYVAQATGSDAVGAFLVQTDGTSPRARRRSASARASARARRSPTSSTSARSSAPT